MELLEHILRDDLLEAIDDALFVLSGDEAGFVSLEVANPLGKAETVGHIDAAQEVIFVVV